MSLLNPVVSKFNLTAGVPQLVYSCPSNKSHATVDLTFYKDNLVTDALIEVAMSTETNPANLTSVDFFIDDIELIGVVNSAELNKVIVGKGENLFLRVVTGPDVVVRLSGVEENNVKVQKAGRLAALAVAGTAQTKIYENALPNISYISASLTVYNSSNVNTAEIQAWISTSGTPSASDKIMKINIPTQDTSIIENILMAPNEKIFVQSSQPNAEYFVNGVVVGDPAV